MKRKDYRIKDDPTIWAKVPRKPDDALDYLFQKLIEENEAIASLAAKHACDIFNKPVRKAVRPGQETFLLLYRLDFQILNGGLTQFFWNAFFEADDVKRPLKKLGLTDLLALYKKMEHDLTEDQMRAWAALYNEYHQSPKRDLALFQKTYAVLNLGWFDKAYLAKHRSRMVKTLLDFILAHKSDFVK